MKSIMCIKIQHSICYECKIYIGQWCLKCLRLYLSKLHSIHYNYILEWLRFLDSVHSDDTHVVQYDHENKKKPTI